MPKLTLTDALAWWGAVVATLVLLWDIYKWTRRGADISVEAMPNMKVHPSVPPTGNKSFIIVTATNHGEQPTTITHLAGIHFPTVWHKLVGRGGRHFGILDQLPGPGLPHVLGPGQQWCGMIDQADVARKFGTTGRLYCGVFHSASKKGIYRLVRLS